MYRPPLTLHLKGRGKFWDGVKSFFGRSKILSNAATLIPGVGPVLSDSIANLGYGKRRRRTATRKVTKRVRRVARRKVAKRKASTRCTCRANCRYKRRGRGWFSKIKNGFSKVFNRAKDINTKLKDGKYISNYGSKISKVVGKIGEISGNEALTRAANIGSDISNRAAAMGYGKPRCMGGKKLPMNGMGIVGAGSITPQARLNMFIKKRLAMSSAR